MTKNLFDEAKKIASNKFLIKRYTPLLDVDSSVKNNANKVRLIFVKIHYKLFNFIYRNRPWTSPASILFFDKVLNNEMTGLEYGSGRSTLYFSKKLKHLVSIEHYEDWYKKVNVALQKNKIKNVDYFLLPKECFPNNKEDLDIYLNEHNELESKKNYEKYYTKVSEYPNENFDFIIVDGRARVRCGLNAISKLKKGGIFVLDNSERKRYKPLHESLKLWPTVHTTNGFTNTTIWFKP